MRVHEEFSRYAAQYAAHNVIQAKVAQKLATDTKDTPKRVLDLGCGNGTLFAHIDWEIETFTGVDFSQSMLSHHPHASNIALMLGDFNDPTLFKTLSKRTFDRIYSASALQWAEDLDTVFQSIHSLESCVSLAIFTSGTFKTLHETAVISPILKSSDEVIKIASRYFDAQYEIVRYTLEFDSVREMFRYIKRSGVSSGRRVLDIAQTKALMRNYPLNYLEFEVVFIQT
ncbi:MAG TPA: methyltransferase domain-containing protein [Sulfuricurvum sp.]|nr:MAG: methyltransferase [Campylobacterales bacterium 16-40-21]OZA01758.1 MAG: methyltransferase [Sulfuricurvum sp. 17-40-25]HQS67518.1 methyltransferase domain-containing protein [Sulfuricurvum sp.]HQT37636.1 methyltransferase domain-containing protein [Sulfuricurvum sp.]